MKDNFIGYLLGALDEEEQRQVEAFIASHPEANAELDLLRHALEPLACDKDVFEPPPDLAMRTIACVAEHIVATEEKVIESGVSPVADFILSLSRRPAPGEMAVYPWHPGEASPPQVRRRDLVATLGLTAALLLIGAAGVMTLRQTDEVQACQNNMRQVHNGLESFCNSQPDGRYPQVGDGEKVETTLDTMRKTCSIAPATLSCPGVTHESKGLAVIDYAYSLGYRDDHGQLAGRFLDSDRDVFPIFADAPIRKDGESTPKNHRKGQNVLFAGGHVRFCTSPNVGPENNGTADDIYFNTERQPRAGNGRWDTVLGCATDQP